jgi:hypothetical protein
MRLELVAIKQLHSTFPLLTSLFPSPIIAYTQRYTNGYVVSGSKVRTMTAILDRLPTYAQFGGAFRYRHTNTANAAMQPR